MSTLKKNAERDARKLAALKRRYEALLRQASRIGCVARGSISTVRLTCGQPTCRCHSDPQHRHGPYVYWTSKIKGKSVSRKLRPAEAELYGEWIKNRQEMEGIIRQLFMISRDIAKLTLQEDKPFIPPA